MQISIGYFTNRKECLFSWFASNLAKQIRELQEPVEVELIVIDNLNREIELTKIARDSGLACPFYVYPPKPSPWQGEWRKTTKDYFAASNTRNTFLIAARGEHLACVDDLSWPGPKFLSSIVSAYKGGYFSQGAYKKLKKMEVDPATGALLSFEDNPPGVDSRWNYGDDDKPVDTHPDWTYGCSLSFPTWVAEATNGFPEDHDGMGYEDINWGFRVAYLPNAPKMYYVRAQLTFESEEHHHTNEVMCRVDKKTPGNLWGDDVSHQVLNKLHHFKQTYCHENNFDLKTARLHFQKTGQFPELPPITYHWPDGQPLSEM